MNHAAHFVLARHVKHDPHRTSLGHMYIFWPWQSTLVLVPAESGGWKCLESLWTSLCKVERNHQILAEVCYSSTHWARNEGGWPMRFRDGIVSQRDGGAVGRVQFLKPWHPWLVRIHLVILVGAKQNEDAWRSKFLERKQTRTSKAALVKPAEASAQRKRTQEKRSKTCSSS